MNAVMYGSVTVAVRGMTKTESTITLLTRQMVVIAVRHSALLAFGLVRPSPADAALFFGSGVANGLAQYLWTKSLHPAPTAAVSPFYYLMLVWAVLRVRAIGRPPRSSSARALLVGAGLTLLAREARADGLRADRPKREDWRARRFAFLRPPASVRPR